MINKKLMREFLTPENIALEVKIILSLKMINSNPPTKNGYFSSNNVKKRYKNLFNSNNFKLS